jgi:hypothetical protein
MSVSILVVDDETDVAELFRQQFRREARQGTYVLHFAYSGEEALDKLAAGIEPQLIVILSDINMPVMVAASPPPAAPPVWGRDPSWPPPKAELKPGPLPLSRYVSAETVSLLQVLAA